MKSLFFNILVSIGSRNEPISNIRYKLTCAYSEEVSLPIKSLCLSAKSNPSLSYACRIIGHRLPIEDPDQAAHPTCTFSLEPAQIQVLTQCSLLLNLLIQILKIYKVAKIW